MKSMKCKNCKSEWNAIRFLESCPYCDESFFRTGTENIEFSLQEILTLVATREGKQLFIESEAKRFYRLISEYVSESKTLKKIRLAISEGVSNEIIFFNRFYFKSKIHDLESLKLRFIENNFIKDEVGAEIISAFAYPTLQPPA